eukprot:TRINITY_DN38592_c0_g1_i1.p1 TRINITY_DN38592_c0_g1~~TRINITY_DN38592_c0_g1_i1.p1  ORF type:complete len:386 (+),score=91.27 TRINITY_DN38592_c0_g1_i1:777-1934(+)
MGASMLHAPKYVVIAVLTAATVSLWAMLYVLQTKLSYEEALGEWEKERKELQERAKEAEAKGEASGGDEEEVAELKKEIKRLKKKEHQSHHRAAERVDEAVLPTHEGIKDLLEKLHEVAAPECTSFNHVDLTPYLIVVPEKLPAWARKYSEGDSLKKETDSGRKDSFDRIAKTGAWSHDNPSGTGSEVGEATDRVLNVLNFILPHVMGKGKTVNMLDIPCGDMTWMPEFIEGNKDAVKYTGVDIVSSLVKAHKKKFSEWGNMDFEARDVVKEGLPKGSYDLIFSRHMLQHLTTADAITVLRHIYKHAQSRSRPTYLLTTTYPDWQAHVDLDPTSSTRVRKLNLQQPPISLPPPLCWSHDFSFSFIALWKFPLDKQPSWVDEEEES